MIAVNQTTSYQGNTIDSEPSTVLIRSSRSSQFW